MMHITRKKILIFFSFLMISSLSYSSFCRINRKAAAIVACTSIFLVSVIREKLRENRAAERAVQNEVIKAAEIQNNISSIRTEIQRLSDGSQVKKSEFITLFANIQNIVRNQKLAQKCMLGFSFSYYSDYSDEEKATLQNSLQQTIDFLKSKTEYSVAKIKTMLLDTDILEYMFACTHERLYFQSDECGVYICAQVRFDPTKSVEKSYAAWVNEKLNVFDTPSITERSFSLESTGFEGEVDEKFYDCKDVDSQDSSQWPVVFAENGGQ